MEHLPGVEIRPEPARRYPYGSLAAHLIGYVGEVSESDLEKSPDGSGDPPYQRGDLIGRSGVERSYERWLRGRDGIEYVEVDAFGRRTNLFEELPSLPSIPGDDVVLTIDLDVQLAAEAALDSVPSRLKKQFGEGAEPRPGCVVAIDARNGEVLAMASRPAFDPNLFIGRISKADWAVLSGDGYPLLNRPIQASYPPGSTFKALTGLAVLHEAGVTPSQPMPSACGGGLYFGNRYFRCHLSRGHGSLGLIMAMAKSCDVYFYQCGIRLGVDRLTRYAEACSVGVPTRVDLPQERSSLVPTLAWFKKARGGPPGPGAALNLSIGQGELLLTPIQIARLYAAIANGGTIVRPHTALRVVDPNGKVVEEFDRDSADEASLPATGVEIAEIQRALEAVVMDPGGTGKQARVGSFRVAGKTGTSQNPHGQDHALFVGYAPADAPEIVVVVVLEQSGHGGAIAAPTAQPVLQTYLMPPPKGMATAPIGMAAAPKAMAAPKAVSYTHL
ncbi:MAG: penicillin-binding protein 2, partial [Candidatus Eisenbacteria bacterium]|nr:penicillin-binding protein 2 [Candidatus Eisenbacteria bacterium]